MNGYNFKNDFPIFEHFAGRGEPLVYLDSAATAQMPASVLEALGRHERTTRANVHRGIYGLSEAATAAYEEARERVRKFLNARSNREIVFTRNTTEAVNLVSRALGQSHFIQSGDHLLVSVAEHHSNFLPWQMLAQSTGAVLDIFEPAGDGIIHVKMLEAHLHPRTKLAAVSHISHVLGTIQPIVDLGKFMHERGVLFFVDAAQSAGHLAIDVKNFNCDFLAFSGHKIGAPAGIGVLYGREELLQKMDPVLYGGGMIREVRRDKSEWHDLPWKFEAGTPNISGAIGLAAAIGYLKGIGFEALRRIDEQLVAETLGRLGKVSGLRLFGPKDPALCGGVVSFALPGIHPHDLATILDRDGICIRAGHHCAMPLMAYLGVPAASRVSFWVYNTLEDVQALVKGVLKAISILKNPKSKIQMSNQNQMSKTQSV